MKKKINFYIEKVKNKTKIIYFKKNKFKEKKKNKK